MSNLSNQQINNSFDGILQVPGGITSSLKTVQDGNGNPTGLQLSSSGANVTTSNTYVASIDGVQIVGAEPRLISDGFGDIVNVKDFGAVGDGVTDDTQAIQDAIDYVCGEGRGCVHFPAGEYKVTDTLTVNSSRVFIAGDGAGASFIYPTGNYGDVLHFSSGTAGTYLQRNGIRDIAFYTQSETTSGATIHLERCRLIQISNVDISAHFGGLWLDSVVHSSFSNVNIVSDAAFTSFKAGSYLMKSTQNATGALTAECHFVNCDWRGQNGNNYLDYSVLIQAADGIWFSNVHWGFCKNSALAIVPQTTTAQVSAINISNCYFDTVQQYGISVVEPVGYIGTVAEICINNGQIYNCGIGIAWNCNNNGSSVISNMQIFEIATHGVQITKGQSLNFNNVDIWAVNKSGTTGYGFDLADSNVQYTQITNSSVRKRGTAYTPSAGINIGAGAANIRIAGMDFEGCTYDIADNSSTTSKDISNNRSSKETPLVTANAGGDLDLPQGFDMFLLDATYNVGSISTRSAWLGRKATLIANGTVNVFDSNNLQIAGTWAATAGDTLSLIYSGSYWYETSRSNNT